MGPPPNFQGYLKGALSRASLLLQSALGAPPGSRSGRAPSRGPLPPRGAPMGPPRGAPGGAPGGAPRGAPPSLTAAAASLRERLAAANEQVGSWALREAPPAFRLKGTKYASYPGGPPRGGPRGGPLEQQKKANLLSLGLVLGSACILIFTPLYLNSLYGQRPSKQH
ncbi:hypothetical protein, conserved [Eimeria tenella]|uniref:Uncharacterized protein n=1 Tax=Eimeria tenella TaxID=5802 RepID=U6L272_EIMTE|nr:hypothetical protein, conserved [Eimeria tenella]CDJ44281.1 hypothetical protein, conserved [Eimeria tenella]|eukprot:XP_013235030.1 hypothetical protein, conserved [Eimeria tenella]